MNPVGLNRLKRVKLARQSLEDARGKLDAALLALGPSPDKVVITAPLLVLLWEAVAARRNLRRIESATQADAWTLLSLDDSPAFRVN